MSDNPQISQSKMILTIAPQWGDWGIETVDTECAEWKKRFSLEESIAMCDDYVLAERNMPNLMPQATAAAKQIVDILVPSVSDMATRYDGGERPYIEITGAIPSTAEMENSGPLMRFYYALIKPTVIGCIRAGIDIVSKSRRGYIWTYLPNGREVEVQKRKKCFNPDLIPDKCLEFKFETEDDLSVPQQQVSFREKGGFVQEQVYLRKGILHLNFYPRNHYSVRQ